MTKYLKINAAQPEPGIIKLAAQYIKAGELVAFPTETVYGLGADAFQPEAVNKIFLAKGRPPENALLVHVSNLEQVQKIAAEVPSTARKLMARFWPGPLSIILPSLPGVPAIIRGGQAGVGLRMPSHPVALAFIEEAGPLAAPSANLYGRPSPTNAGHVRQDLDGRITAVLDAGDTRGGLESTLIDLSPGNCRLLRQGAISIELIEECLGQKIELVAGTESRPGYKTKVQVILSASEADFEAQIAKNHSRGTSLGVVGINNHSGYKIKNVKPYFNLDLSGAGFNLYAIIREAEANGVETLLFAPIDSEQAGAALMERLQRAASNGASEE